MTVKLRNLAKMQNFMKGKDTYLESGGRITLYPNMVKNTPMWHFWMII